MPGTISTAFSDHTASPDHTDFPDHTVDSAPEAARPTLQKLQQRFSGLPPAVARMSTSPELLDAFLTANSYFERSSLDALTRETLVMTVAVRNDCHVCIEMHTAALRRLDAEPELIDALRAGRPVDNPKLAALQAFTRAVIDTAGAVTDAQLAAFTAQGFGPRQALDVVLGVGTYTLSTFGNRMTRA